jgi:plasmid stabilization system protein ParE
VSRRRVVWAKVARRDLYALVDYLADRSPRAALGMLDRLEAAAGHLVRLSARGRVVPELARLHIRDYRELVVPPYRLAYRSAGSRVFVVGVFDSRRSLEDVLLDRILREDPEEP